MGIGAWLNSQRQWRRDHIAAFSAVSQKQSDGLTLFQHQAINALSHIVPLASFKRVAERTEGEEFLSASLGNSGSELYIHSNEATISGVEPAWFEEWGYRTPADLLEALARECARRAA